MTSPEQRQRIDEWSTMSGEAITNLDPEGDFFKKHLLNPTVFEMLGDVAGKRVLDAGSGQGYFSRLLAGKGAQVVSVEPAGPLFEHSLRMEEQLAQGIELHQADLTDVAFEVEFDAVVANMVFLSIPDWEAALQTCVRALRPGGRLVFSVEHPCFETATNEWASSGRLTITEYLLERPVVKTQATDYHRTLSTYVNAVVRSGCRIDAIAEPGLPPELVADPECGPDQESLVHVPNALVVSAIREEAAR